MTFSPNSKVLLVEDEALVRLMAVDMLAEFGLSTIEAGNAAQAMAAITSNGIEHFAVAVIDVGLPDMPGDRLAADLRALRADLPVLLTSGCEIGDETGRLRDQFTAVLGKPFTMSMLRESLAALGVSLNPED